MNIYRIDVAGRAPIFRGRQSEAKQLAKALGGTWDAVAVVMPDRMDARLDWLNVVLSAAYNAGLADAAGVTAKAAEPAYSRPDWGPVPPAMDPKSVTSMLARVDSPDVDRICDTIGESSGPALARFASCVAVRFNALARKED